MTHHWLVTAALAGMLSLASAVPAAALTGKENKCQKAIGSAGRVLLVKSLVTRAKCATKDLKGKQCDPTAKVVKFESKARTQITKACTGADLSQLNTGSCAARASGSASALADCIVDSHGSAVLDLIVDQFGRSQSGTSVTVEGTLTSAGAVVSVGPHLRAAGVTAPLALTDLKIFCVTFEEPPAAGSSNVSADGSFSVTIAALGVPFGCFVIDSTSGEQVATLVLRRNTTSLSGSGSTDTTQITSDDGGIDLGGVTLNLDEGIAVADAGNVDGATDDDIDNPFDPTGTWNFGCVEPPANSGYASCADMDEGPEDGEVMFLHRISGTDASGSKRHGLGIWQSQAAFLNCGGIEGVATTPGGTATSVGITLDAPDGVFQFTSDTQWKAFIDDLTSARPDGYPDETGVCGSTALHCSGVQNGDLADPTPENCGALTPPQGCWGFFNPQTETYTPFTNAECVDLCYQNNLYSDQVEMALLDPVNGFCIEETRQHYHGSGPPELEGTDRPISRHMFEEMVYTSNTAASLTGVEPTETVTLYDPSDTSGEEVVCHVTRTIKINVNMIDPNTIAGEFSETATLRAGDPDACSDDSNGWVGRMVNNRERMLFKLTR
jgi:hypothetical protein